MKLRHLLIMLLITSVVALTCASWVYGAARSRPNILLAIADDWSFGHAGAYDCNWVKTPSFDRVAREGILFTHAFTSNPKCSPSRASMLTGRNTWQLKEAVNHISVFPNDFAVYPDLLEKAGYYVGFAGKGWAPGNYKVTGFEHNPAGHEYVKYRLKPPHKGISPKDYARNFEDFIGHRPKGQPFCFWYGGHEPHRGYEDGAGIREGKNPKDVAVPAFFPDNATIRGDLLDYSVEVEWFDTHLGRIIKKLEEIGELDNTLILVTSDHGMPFPRVKGQIFEQGFHLPLAVRWGAHIKSGRVIDDFINARDFAPTFMEAVGLEPAPTMTGRSFLDVLESGKSGVVDPSRDVTLAGKERHDLGRPHDWGYPVRAIRTPEYLYVRNYEPDRWPAGNPETGYRNCDNSPTKTYILRTFDNFYRLSFGKRQAEELYRVTSDADCVKNLAYDTEYAAVKRELSERMERMLRDDGDPRALGNAQIFDTYQYVGGRDHAYDTWLKYSKP